MSSAEKDNNKEKNEKPRLPKNWDRCHVYIEKKRRFCRQKPHNPKSVYCGNHQHLEVKPVHERKRIPCPIDSSHLIYEDMVEKHILICPKAKKRKRQEEEPYFKENVNNGGHGDLCQGLSSRDTNTLEWAQRVAKRVLKVHQRLFLGSKDQASPTAVTAQDLYSAIPLRDHSRQEIDAGILEGFQLHRIKSGGSRHVPQLASLVGHLREIEVLPQINNTKPQTATENPLILLEMGAGRGMFGLTAAGVAGAGNINTHLVMVERTGSRSKADKIFRSLPATGQASLPSYLRLDNVQWSRVDCDLSHVNLPVVLQQVDSKNDAKVVVIAKHLCGAGTDLALKSMECIRDQVCACVLATCCHGICDWEAYVGRDFLRQEMEGAERESIFGPSEFDLMRRWCAGSVACNSSNNDPRTSMKKQTQNDADVDVEHTSGRKLEETGLYDNVGISAIVQSLELTCGAQGLGRACQRLIDYGRSEYLRSSIFADQGSASVDICHYVTAEVTPQNAVIIARFK